MTNKHKKITMSLLQNFPSKSVFTWNLQKLLVGRIEVMKENGGWLEGRMDEETGGWIDWWVVGINEWVDDEQISGKWADKKTGSIDDGRIEGNKI